MKTKVYIWSFLISCISFSHDVLAQPLVAWDKTIGGSGYDQLSITLPTSDGGYLLAGYSYSEASGDKSESGEGKNDYWIVKIDAKGNKVWDKIYGGSKDDYLRSATPTSDGGYLLAGTSASPASGDKTEDNKGSCSQFVDCDADYWIVKIDRDGNKLWDKTFGGSGADALSALISTSDGGYLLAGSSASPASGDKSEDRRGGCGQYGIDCFADYWIIKIDEHGNKLWDKTFGGDVDDGLEKIIATTDGGYLLAGTSASPASGDKTEDSKGERDYWLVKTDKHGNKIWDKTIGGSIYDILRSAISTNDEGYLLAGSSTSPASGDKTENRTGGYDYWIVRINAQGEILWDKTIGGNDADFFSEIIAIADGGYLLTGHSSSKVSGDKTENWKGGSDYWIVRMDEQGKIIWDKTLGGRSYDFLRSTILTHDGDYLLTGTSEESPASGDKTEDSKGGTDFWIIKLVESFSIHSFTLVNAATDEALQTIADGNTIDLAKLPTHQLSIKATSEIRGIGSVYFHLTGPFVHQYTENYAPYALFGDNPAGNFSGRLLPPGEYSLTATPYAGKTKGGRAGTPLNIHFTIIDSEEAEDSQVTAFTLYDAVTDQKIMDLEDGTVVHKDELEHEELTVLIHTIPDFVGSVNVELWGPLSLTRTENTKPYALFRNNSKDLFGEALPAGEYTLKAIPYPEENAQGAAGKPLEISFTVVGADTHARLTAYPVPTSGMVHINYEKQAEEVQLMLLDFSGQPLLTLPLKGQAQLDLSVYRKGIYYLKVVDQQGVHLKRVVVE